MLDPFDLPALQPALHGALDDLLEALPIQAEQPGGGRHPLRGLQHADGEGLKKQRVTAVRCGAWSWNQQPRPLLGHSKLAVSSSAR